MARSKFIGLDLGQAQDFTALAVVSRPRRDVYTNKEPAKPPYDLPYLKRFPLGTPYTEIAPFVVELLKTPELTDSHLLVDYTGVGRAVGELFCDAIIHHVNCWYMPVLITSGHTVIESNGFCQIPKTELVSALQVLLQTRRLKIAPSLPDAELLVKELQNFRTKVTVAGTDPLEAWREGQHDDMVLSVALAVWVGEQALSEEKTIQTRLVGSEEWDVTWQVR
jgi:hypothetical protein